MFFKKTTRFPRLRSHSTIPVSVLPASHVTSWGKSSLTAPPTPQLPLADPSCSPPCPAWPSSHITTRRSLYWFVCMHTMLGLTLCNPMDCSLPGTSIHEISPGKNTGVGCHFLLQGIFPNRNQNYISCVSCIGMHILYQLSHGGSAWIALSANISLSPSTGISTPQILSAMLASTLLGSRALRTEGDQQKFSKVRITWTSGSICGSDCIGSTNLAWCKNPVTIQISLTIWNQPSYQFLWTWSPAYPREDMFVHK